MAEVYSKWVRVGVLTALTSLSVSSFASINRSVISKQAEATAKSVDPRYFEIAEIKTIEVPIVPAGNGVERGPIPRGTHLFAEPSPNGNLTVVPAGIAMGACESAMGPYVVPDIMDPTGALDAADVIIDKVINIGKKIWTIVQAGKPTVNIRSDVATALPQGSRCWTDLQTWQRPQSKIYQVSFKNGFGMEVVKFNYRIIWLPGGSFEGAGSYIGYAAMVPMDVSVSWGFQLDADASVPTVFNMGTREQPVAGMQMSMIYRIQTAFQTTEQSQAFFVDGKGSFEQMQ